MASSLSPRAVRLFVDVPCQITCHGPGLRRAHACYWGSKESEVQTEKQPAASLYHRRCRKRSKERCQTTQPANTGQTRGEKHQKQPQVSERKTQVSGRKTTQ